MANSISVISVDFTAKVSSFIEGLKKVKKETGDFTAQVTKAAAGGAAGAFAIMGASVTALAVGIAKSTAEMARFNDEASKLGMSVSSYAVLATAADDLGVNLAALSGVYTALTTKMEAGIQGDGETVKVFDKLGLNIQKLRALKPEEQLAEIAQAFSQMQDGPEKNALGVALFGKRFNELRPILEGGKQAMIDAAIEAGAFGQSLSKLDYQNVKEMNNSFGDLKDASSGVFNILASTVASMLNGPLKQFIQWLKDTNAVFNTARFIVEMVTNAMVGLGYVIDSLKVAYNALRTVVYGILTAMLFVTEMTLEAWNVVLKGITKGVNAVILEINKVFKTNLPTIDLNIDAATDKINTIRVGLANATKDSASTITQDWGKVAAFAGQIKTQIVAALDAVEKRSDTTTQNIIDNLNKAGKAAGDNIDIITKEQQAAQARLLKEDLKAYEERLAVIKQNLSAAAAYNPESAYEKSMERLRYLYGENNEFKYISDEQYTAAKLKLDEQLQRSQYDVFAATHKNQAILIEGFAGMADGMAQAIVAGESLGKAFKMAFKSMLADIATLILKAIFLNILYSMLGLVDASAGTRMAAGLAKFTGMGARADGGPITAGSPYLVGERGPELIVPKNDGYVIPNDILRESKQDRNTIVQNLYISTGVSQTVRAELMQMMPQIKAVAVAGVLDAKQRGGAYAAAMNS